MSKKLIFIGIVIVLIAIIVISFYQTNKPQIAQRATNIEQAVHMTNIAQIDNYGIGEVSVEGHVILGSDVKDVVTTVYAISSYSRFGFEDGIFTTFSGAFRIPTVITFSKNDKGEYILLKYQKPLDGSLNGESIRQMFPPQYLDNAIHADKFNDELVTQQNAQATEYLERINRVASVDSDSHGQGKKLPTIDVEASNELLNKINNFPYWLGTIEQVENDERYVYETSQSKTDDGYDLMIYTKKRYDDGKIVEIYRYKIVGSKIFLQ